MIVQWGPGSDAYEAVEEIVLAKYGSFHGSFLVHLRTKYHEDDKWTNLSELFMDDGDDWMHPSFVWETDWWEGEQYVDLVAIAPIDEIKPIAEFMVNEKEFGYDHTGRLQRFDSGH